VASEYELHPNQVSQWKRQLLKEGAAVFGAGTVGQQREPEAREAQLYEQIGRLKMELEWLKKRLPTSVEEKRAMIEFCHPAISVRRQCELMGLNRARLDSQPATDPPARAVISATITYFENNLTCMNYYEYRKQGYHIGSGLAEAACKHVVGARFKQSGMTNWTTTGAEAVLRVRVAIKNDTFERLCDELARQRFQKAA
jgi:putative transposase